MSFSDTDRQVFDEVVTKVFGDLVKKGFRQAGVALRNTKALGDYLETEIAHDRYGTDIRISFLQTPDGSRNEVTVFFERGKTDTFEFGEFLKSLGADDGLIRQSNLSAYHGALVDRLSRCLTFIRQQIDQRHLLDALAGGDWPHVPMDWGDYK